MTVNESIVWLGEQVEKMNAEFGPNAPIQLALDPEMAKQLFAKYCQEELEPIRDVLKERTPTQVLLTIPQATVLLAGLKGKDERKRPTAEGG